MRLTFKVFDGRQKIHREIIDEDSGQRVGDIQSNGVGFGTYGDGIDVSLFGGRYAITVHRYEECWGFVKGVETVLNHILNHMTSIREINTISTAA
jgi:hypothetical protein